MPFFTPVAKLPIREEHDSVIMRVGRSSGFRFVLLAALPANAGSGFAAFVPVHSGGPATESHRFPFAAPIGAPTSLLTRYHTSTNKVIIRGIASQKKKIVASPFSHGRGANVIATPLRSGEAISRVAGHALEIASSLLSSQ
jgi:hypothetical protein